jgi:hypothetical protein
MAARLVKVITGQVTLTTSGTAYYPCRLIAPSDQDLKILKLNISCDGVSGTDAQAAWSLIRSTGGTWSSLTPVKYNDIWGGTLRTTASHTATVDPTPGDTLASGFYHNQIGIERSFADYPVIVGAGTHVSVKITPGTSGRKVIIEMLVEE